MLFSVALINILTLEAGGQTATLPLVELYSKGRSALESRLRNSTTTFSTAEGDWLAIARFEGEKKELLGFSAETLISKSDEETASKIPVSIEQCLFEGSTLNISKTGVFTGLYGTTTYKLVEPGHIRHESTTWRQGDLISYPGYYTNTTDLSILRTGDILVLDDPKNSSLTVYVKDNANTNDAPGSWRDSPETRSRRPWGAILATSAKVLVEKFAEAYTIQAVNYPLIGGGFTKSYADGRGSFRQDGVDELLEESCAISCRFDSKTAFRLFGAGSSAEFQVAYKMPGLIVGRAANGDQASILNSTTLVLQSKSSPSTWPWLVKKVLQNKHYEVAQYSRVARPNSNAPEVEFKDGPQTAFANRFDFDFRKGYAVQRGFAQLPDDIHQVENMWNICYDLSKGAKQETYKRAEARKYFSSSKSPESSSRGAIIVGGIQIGSKLSFVTSLDLNSSNPTMYFREWVVIGSFACKTKARNSYALYLYPKELSMDQDERVYLKALVRPSAPNIKVNDSAFSGDPAKVVSVVVEVSGEGILPLALCQ